MSRVSCARWTRYVPLVAAMAALGACGQVPDHVNDPTITQESCWSCHGDLYLATTEPDHVAAALPHTCETCHDTTAWRPAAFPDHDPFWPLTGAHTTAACAECHVGGRYAGTPRECVGCHQDAFDQSANPPHVADTFPTSCEGCHETTAWRPASVDDHGRFWVLEGAHTALDCTACHDTAAWADAPRDCVGCHQADYDQTTDPNHVASGYPTSCAVCHTAVAWRPANFRDHDLYWPLEGHHLETACEACHADDRYQGTPRDCEGCHLPDYQATTAPAHAAADIPTACAGCHTPEGWSPAGFAVHDEYWPLAGKHAEARCAECHEGGVYAGTPRECDGCHHADFVATSDPDHEALGYPVACEVCHQPTAWKPSSFDHEATWPLTGRHLETACADCHADGVYSGTPRDCDGCHRPDYDATTAPPHAAADIGHDCVSCHQTGGWAPASLDHTPYWPLEGKHLQTGCTECHVDGVYAGTPKLCDGCHLADYEQTTAPPHAAAQLGHDCESCHEPSGWTPAELDHDVFWPLLGKHTEAACTDCHVDGVYEGTARACVGCHQVDYDLSEEPPHKADGYPTDCERCHDSKQWKPNTFDHTSLWPLLGVHATTACAECHPAGHFENTPEVCVDCHLTDFTGATEPPHEATTFGQDCATCHVEAGWSPSSFDHTGIWPITGAHATTACVACHTGGHYANTETTCEGCHLPDYTTSANPPHAAEGFPTDCDRCHATGGWQPSSFDHESFWPLLGAHATTACSGCHAGGQFQDTPDACVACHLPDFQGATAPIHDAATFGQDCATCHGEAGWSPSSFDHTAIWPITGAHAAANCAACHAGGHYANTASTCDGCHHAAFVATDAPPHVPNLLPTGCDDCHGTSAWSPSTFDHAATWPLVGEHTAASCVACHVGGTYAGGTPSACDGCHHGDYLATTDPIHADAGFPTTCNTCHTPFGWTGANFDHSQLWPLTGRHSEVDCNACHTGGSYANTPNTCDGCHHPDFVATTNPNHAQAGFPTSCDTCHGTSAWTDATFDHDQFWALTGAHTSAACTSCHQGGVYAGTPQQCDGCHHPDYVATTDPNHAQAGFPTDCATCHDTATWTGATFDHGQFWPLTGAHTSATCTSCHQGGVYAGTPQQCDGCHHPDYAGATNPSHVALNLSTTCQTCHGTSSWATTTFPGHDTLFRISSGDHSHFTCAQCHPSAATAWSAYICVACHTGEHTLTRMANKHTEVTEYNARMSSYPSYDAACLSCHPKGLGGD